MLLRNISKHFEFLIVTTEGTASPRSYDKECLPHLLKFGDLNG